MKNVWSLTIGKVTIKKINNVKDGNMKHWK